MRLTAKFGGNSNRACQSAASTTNADPSPQGRATEPAPSAAAKNLALAHHIERLIDRGVIVDYTEAARMLGVSQPRMTHLMGLVLLAPANQEAILVGELAPRDKELRELARLLDWQTQESSIRTR